MAKDRYIYPAIFEYADDGISISFPDIPGCFSCADTDEEALYMAKDALGLMLYSMEQDGISIPKPAHLKDIRLQPEERAVLIEVYMPLVRKAIESSAVKKTLTIPSWLNQLAEKNRINFSQVLQDALKERLGLNR